MFITKSKVELQSHQSTHIYGKKPFKCQQCAKTFRSKWYLIDHQRQHTDSMPYSCLWPKCEYMARHYSTLIEHIRAKHFKIPRTIKKQKECGIVDIRDPRLYVQFNKETATNDAESFSGDDPDSEAPNETDTEASLFQYFQSFYFTLSLRPIKN